MERRMKFELPAGNGIEIDDVADAQAAVKAICAHEGMKREIESVARGEGFRRYAVWERMGEDTVREIAAVLLERGTEAAEAHIADVIVDEYNSGAEHFFHETMAARSDGFGRLMDALIDPIQDATGESREAVSDMLIEELKGRVCEALDMFDHSKPFDIVPPDARVEMYHVFGGEDGTDIMDLAFSEYASNVMSIRSVMPGEPMKRLFEGVNADFDAFVALVKDTHGVDLRGGPRDKDLVAWLATGDYIRQPDDPRVRSDAAARAVAWQAFAPTRDPDRGTAATAKNLYDILDNSDQGGVPCYVCRMRLADLVGFDWSKPMATSQSGQVRSEGVRSGGFVGIFEPVNGSGHIVRAQASLGLPAGREAWRISGVHGRVVDDTFGNVDSYYHAEPKVDERRLAAEASSAPAL
jgi:hypothetical protein